MDKTQCCFPTKAVDKKLNSVDARPPFFQVSSWWRPTHNPNKVQISCMHASPLPREQDPIRILFGKNNFHVMKPHASRIGIVHQSCGHMHINGYNSWYNTPMLGAYVENQRSIREIILYCYATSKFYPANALLPTTSISKLSLLCDITFKQSQYM